MYSLYNFELEDYVMIYGVDRNFKGETIFLIYYDDEWAWTHSEHFAPTLH